MNYRVYNKAVFRLRYPYCEVAATFLSYGRTLPADCGSDGRELYPQPLGKVLNVPMAAGVEPTPISRHSSVPFLRSDTGFVSFFSRSCW